MLLQVLRRQLRARRPGQAASPDDAPDERVWLEHRQERAALHAGSWRAMGGGDRSGRRSHRLATFVRNHAHAVVACDFFTTVTVRFRILY